MYPDLNSLEEVIEQAESGDIEGARERLRHFTERRPSVLLAWKWLADLAESPKERSAAIRRAQLLAPGDPWVIEAKKHKMPPKTKRRGGKKPSDTAQSSSSEFTSAALDEHDNGPDLEEIDSGVSIGEKKLNSEGSAHASVDSLQSPSLWTARDLDVSRKTDPLVWVSVILGVSGLFLIAVAWNLMES